MSHVVKDRVKETTSTTGTGTITLLGAASGYISFSAIGNGNTTYYTIVCGSDWEVGIGTYTSSGTTLSRDTVLASSTGSKINLTGTSTVFCDYPAEKAVYLDPVTNLIETAKIATGTASANTVLRGDQTWGEVPVNGQQTLRNAWL